jgi:hypothetical protein
VQRSGRGLEAAVVGDRHQRLETRRVQHEGMLISL